MTELTYEEQRKAAGYRCTCDYSPDFPGYHRWWCDLMIPPCDACVAGVEHDHIGAV